MALQGLFVFLVFIFSCHGSYIYKTEYVDVPIDHFSFVSNNTFKLRYLINDSYWSPGNPIFFYTGNEGDVVVFAENTGFMWEAAEKMNAMVVFAEHRYYGDSLPFGNKSFIDSNHLGYLTTSQALADYVYLIKDIEEKRFKNKKSPVVAFGGSYGGMLSAWIRLKYPSSVFASVASSAPIFQFKGLAPCDGYFNIISSVFNISAPHGICARNIKKSWKILRDLKSNPNDKKWFSTEWNFCKAVDTDDDFKKLTEWLKDIYSNFAMANYPYPADFLAEMPANPVREMCRYLDNSKLEGKPLITALGKALSVYTNFTGKTKCLDINTSIATGIGEKAWNFQACTELVMPMCIKENDMFEEENMDWKALSDDCTKEFGISYSRKDLPVLEYGGKIAPYSNVIFTNGLLDPWSAGGVQQSNIPSVYSILIPGAAHHLDLRATNSNDPEVVKIVRLRILKILESWISIYKN